VIKPPNSTQETQKHERHTTGLLKKKIRIREIWGFMSRITESARGEECCVHIPGVCNWNNETTVFSHLNGAGMGMKHQDLFGCYACSDCHSWLDGGYVQHWYKADRDSAHLFGMFKTQQKLIEKGLVVLI
jgi:Protein of unknown function (DUF1364)